MNYAVTRLTTLPDVAVYIDAGEPTWPTVGESIRFPCAPAGIAKARGFVEERDGHFGSTKRNVRYGNRIAPAPAQALPRQHLPETPTGSCPKRVWRPPEAS